MYIIELFDKMWENNPFFVTKKYYEEIMIKLIDKFNWECGCWITHIVFFAITTIFATDAITADNTPESLLYYSVISSVLVLISTINIFFSSEKFKNIIPKIKYIVALFIVIMNTYIIPFSLNAYGQAPEIALTTTLLYLIIIIAISPRTVAIGALVAAISFSCYFVSENSRLLAQSETIEEVKEDNKEEDKKLTLKEKKEIERKQNIIENEKAAELQSKYILLSIYFVLAACVAFCWRLLIKKMVQLFKLAGQNTSSLFAKKIKNLEDTVDKSESEKLTMKEEMALQIMEMNQLTGAEVDFSEYEEKDKNKDKAVKEVKEESKEETKEEVLDADIVK